MPVSTIDLGLGPVSDGSYKAGEYNGLEKSGAFAHRERGLAQPRRLRQHQRVAMARQGHRSRAQVARPDRADRRAGPVPGHVWLRRAAEKPIGHVSNAVQRCRVHGPHVAGRLAGADSGRQRRRQLGQRPRPGAGDRHRAVHQYDGGDQRCRGQCDPSQIGAGRRRRRGADMPRSTTSICRPPARATTRASTTSSIRGGRSTPTSAQSTRTD